MLITYNLYLASILRSQVKSSQVKSSQVKSSHYINFYYIAYTLYKHFIRRIVWISRL